MSVDALGNSCHFGVIVPVELLTRRHDDKEKSELFLSFDGESDDTGWSLDLCHDFVEFREIYFVDFFHQEFEVV